MIPTLILTTHPGDRFGKSVNMSRALQAITWSTIVPTTYRWTVLPHRPTARALLNATIGRKTGIEMRTASSRRQSQATQPRLQLRGHCPTVLSRQELCRKSHSLTGPLTKFILLAQWAPPPAGNVACLRWSRHMKLSTTNWNCGESPFLPGHKMIRQSVICLIQG